MKNIKKYISLLLAFVIMMAASSVAMVSYAEEPTIVCSINDKTFPDKNLLAVVKDWYDLDGDDILSYDEVKDVTLIALTGMLDETCGEDAIIEDLTGINYFFNCKRLRYSMGDVKVLPIDKLTELVELNVGGNELTTLDVSNQPKLDLLRCSGNHLTTLDVSKNPLLRTLACENNKIANIKFSANAGLSLETLSVYNNELTSLEVGQFTKLKKLNCSNNHLKTLDLSKNTALGDITNASIGDQTVSAAAVAFNGVISVNYILPTGANNITSTSCETVSFVDEEEITNINYDGRTFSPLDLDNLIKYNGIDYYYNTGLDTAEAMRVHIDVSRRFYQVKFYTNENKTTLIKTETVSIDQAATAPTIPDAPQCKKFNSWSEDFSSVTKDIETYIIWDDDHNEQVVSFKDNVVSTDCVKCANMKHSYDFEDLVNLRSNDDGYVAIVDRNGDGVINAKDYAIILVQFL